MTYLDNAAATRPTDECLRIYSRYQTDAYYNPSALYAPAVRVRAELESARRGMLRLLKGSGRLVFVSSGTESNNLALFGATRGKRSRIVVSAAEHPSVLNAAKELKAQGRDAVVCPTDGAGRVAESDLARLVDDSTELVSIMHVNNLTGAVNDIRALRAAVKRANPRALFHSDGVQAAGKIDVRLDDLGVDLYSFCAHKIHGVKGIAALYARPGLALKPRIYGGGQEFGLRSSTENVGGIMSFACALSESLADLNRARERASAYRAELADFFESLGFRVVSGADQSPFILCCASPKARGEAILHALERHEVCVGTGSACSSASGRVASNAFLKLPAQFASGVIRISFSRFTTESDICELKNRIESEYPGLCVGA